MQRAPFTWLARCPFWQIQAAWILIVVGLSVWFLIENRQWDWRWHLEDPMAFSGFLAVILGIAYSVAVDEDQCALVHRWHVAGLIDIDHDALEVLNKKAIFTSVSLQLSVGGIILIAMYIGYRWIAEVSSQTEFFFASMLCGILVGVRLGRLASHGLLGRYLRTHNVPFWLTVGHPDRAGGLARIGRFFLLQAFSVMALVAWLSAWIILVAFGGYANYQFWLNHFLVLLAIALIIFGIAFLLPVSSIRATVLEWKAAYADPEIDRIRFELNKLRQEQVGQDRQIRKEREVVAELEEVLALPNWPIAPKARGVFITGIAMPFLVNLAAAVVS